MKREIILTPEQASSYSDMELIAYLRDSLEDDVIHTPNEKMRQFIKAFAQNDIVSVQCYQDRNDATSYRIEYQDKTFGKHSEIFIVNGTICETGFSVEAYKAISFHCELNREYEIDHIDFRPNNYDLQLMHS